MLVAWQTYHAVAKPPGWNVKGKIRTILAVLTAKTTNIESTFLTGYQEIIILLLILLVLRPMFNSFFGNKKPQPGLSKADYWEAFELHALFDDLNKVKAVLEHTGDTRIDFIAFRDEFMEEWSELEGENSPDFSRVSAWFAPDADWERLMGRRGRVRLFLKGPTGGNATSSGIRLSYIISGVKYLSTKSTSVFLNTRKADLNTLAQFN